MPEPSPTRRAFLGSLGAAAIGAVAGCAAPVGSQTGSTPTEGRPTATAGSPFTRVYRDSIGSVVLVQVAGPSFGGQGSGFVFDDAGHVLTNQHVVEGAERIDLRFSDGDWRTATVVGTDVYSDLAVLAVDGAASAPRLPFAERPPAIGTRVVAIGSPFGLERSLSAGIVSGTGRAIPTAAGFTIPDSIQTDAALNPGNSGGPLLTLDGDVVGVIRSGGGDNIGFAISAALVQRVAPTLAEDGEYDHPYMGVGILDVSPTIADAVGLERVTGVLVTQVVPDGPSDGVLRGSTGTEEVAGIEVPVGGDVILRMGGEPIPTGGALGRHLALETRPGETVPVEIVRDGERRTVDLTLGARPPPGQLNR
ncbi:MAG: trypsin-like peptidase domain-containing protein [Halobacteriales archaeon]|nr:trypsin-like peptidase domain-containing protein [Halobacteriales archaeon]